MSSRTRSIRFPADLFDAMNLRAEGLIYPGVNAYVVGLVRYDLLVQGPHTLTLPWADSSHRQQDAIDSRLLDLTRRGVGERGQLLTHIMERIQGGASLADALSRTR